MQLIQSKLIPEAQNVFWHELPATWQALPPRSCLVLARPFAEGSSAQTTLLKMLEACRLAPQAYHILQVAVVERIAWHKLHTTLAPRQVLLLGIHPAELGIQAAFKLYEPNEFGGCTFIPSIALSELDASPQAKKDFWSKGLKPVFVP